LDKYYYLPLAA